jgi:hypothetical protein
MGRIYNVDEKADRDALKALKPYPELCEAYPRQSIYGSPGAQEMGLTPVEAVPDILIQPEDYKDAIQVAHDDRTMPVYHQRNSWAPDGFKWDQKRLPYCWAWGMSANVMDCRAQEGKDTIVLAPNSLGGAVNWQSRGYFLDGTIAHAKKYGITPMSNVPDMHSRNPRTFKTGWEEDALLYRPDDIWDTRSGDMIRHAISILCYGRSLYVAYNWWGHALECCGIIWDESETNNLIWHLRNSHGETTILPMTGNRAVPDEAYSVLSTVLAA